MNRVKDLMCEQVLTINKDDIIINAYKMMSEKNIRHLPVLDNDGALVGILSDRDVQKAMITKKLNEFHNEINIPKEFKVSNFMNWPVCTVGINTHLKTATDIMLRDKISALVVQDDHGHINGIITSTDLLVCLSHMIEESERGEKWTQWTLAYYLRKK
jgi:acetoin utilization protein AcuB